MIIGFRCCVRFCEIAAIPRVAGWGQYAERLDEGEQQQFAAMTFDLGADFGLYVAFRGTDGTLVGWKEDFNMAVRCPVPSQESAYRYADSILDRTERFPLGVKKSPDIMIGGHSKGGNMAVYAAMQITQSDIEATNERAQRLGLLPALGGSVPGRNCRISRIFSHDGPGMSQVMVHSRAYQAIAARIDKTVPESSIIGMLLQSQIKPTFVKADAISILQHMGSSWQVTQSGEFEQASELTGGAQLIGKTIDGWFDRVSQEQRERGHATRYTTSSQPRGTVISLIWWRIGRIRCRKSWQPPEVPTCKRANSSKTCSRRFQPVRRKSLSGNCATTRRGMRDGQYY